MDFREPQEYVDLADSVARTLDEHWSAETDGDAEQSSQAAADVWRALYDLGVATIGTEDSDSSDDTALQAEMVTARALGARAAPTAFVWSAGMAVPLARLTGDTVAVAAACDGSPLTIGLGRTEDLVDPLQSLSPPGNRVYLPCPALARYAMAVVPTAPDAVRVHRLDLMQLTVTDTKRSDLQQLGWVEIPSGTPEVTVGATDLRRIVTRTKLLLAAYAVGGARRVVDMTAQYAQQRQQFGKPIGAFQAVAHRCADMHVSAESADALVNLAAYTVHSGDTAAAWRAAALAKAEATSGFASTGLAALQVFAGHGFSRESQVQVFFRAARGLEVTWGTPTQEFDTAGSPASSVADVAMAGADLRREFG